MGTKRYVVREGFNYRTKSDRGDEKVYSEGDTLTLDPDLAVIPHQLELADVTDRDAAAKAEAKIAKAEAAARGGNSGGVDSEALASAIADGVARALAAMQTTATAVPAA